MSLRKAAIAMIAGIACVSAGAATSDVTLSRYFGPSVDVLDLVDMCRQGSDVVACILIAGEPLASPDCEPMRTAPTDRNIESCYGRNAMLAPQEARR